MSTTTNLGLFKHDNPATNTNAFDVKTALNDNWDKIDEEVGDIDNNITTIENNLNVEITNRQLVTENLQNQINSLASGSPLVASSVSEMTDTSRVYVNTTDGNWYYYNGTAWVSGGVYQSASLVYDSTLTQNNQISNSKSVGDRLNPIVETENYFDINNIVDNKYYDGSGNWIENNEYLTSNLIFLKSGETIYCSNINVEYASIEKVNICDFQGNFIERINPISSNHFTATENCFVKFTIRKKSTLLSINDIVLWKKLPKYTKPNYEYKLNFEKTILNNKKNIEDITKQHNYFDYENCLLNAYLNSSGLITGNSNTYFLTNPIECKIGDIFYSKYFGVTDNVPLFLQVTKYDENGNRIERENINNNIYTSNHNGYVIFNCSKSSNLTIENLYAISKNENISQYYPFKKYVELNSDNVSMQKINNTNYKITFGQFNVTLFKTVDATTNANNWNLKEIKKGDNVIVPEGTDIIGPVKLTTNNDFIGGVHGDETTDYINVSINGQNYQLNEINNISGDNMTILMKSSIYDEITKNKVFDRFVTLFIEKNKIKVSCNYKAVTSTSLQRATNGGLIGCRNNIIKHIMFNNSYFDTPPSASISNNSKNNTSATISTLYGTITVNNIKGYMNENYQGNLGVFTSENPMRCKVYFDTYKNGNYPIDENDEINGEFEYLLS